MSRTDQFMGLNLRAIKFLNLTQQVQLGERRIMHRYPDGSTTDTDWQPVLGTTTKIEPHRMLEGAFGNESQLLKYELSDGRKFVEDVQCAPWSSGPMFFLALKDEKGEWVKESFWTNEDSGTEGLVFDPTLSENIA